MITAIASDLNIIQKIYINCKNPDDFNNQKNLIIKQLELDQSKTLLLPIFPQQEQGLLHQRDELVLNNADIIIPVSIRSDGYMMSYIKSNITNQIIIYKFRTEYQKRSVPLKYSISNDNLNSELNQLDYVYLIHWTRTANYNWPDETKAAYWSDVVTFVDYPRTAYDTLKHILSTRKIISSARHMPKGVKTVSFTGLSPVDSLSLMKWRARYREMSFEPYGMAIEKKWGIENGITAVKYFDPLLGQKPDIDEIWQSHSIGEKTNWEREHEYRCNGDLDLIKIPEDKLLILCYKPEEAQIVEDKYKIKAIPITDY